MLRIRYGEAISPGGAGLAYVKVPPATPRTHLARADYSIDIPENVADNYGADINVDTLVPEHILTRKFLVSPRSVFSRDISKVAKLFYFVDLQFPVVDTEASTVDLVAAAQTIRNHLAILDGANNNTQDLNWDIEVLSLAGADSFNVRIFTDRVGQGQTFKVRYNAFVNGFASPNRREILNPAPIIRKDYDYVLVDDGIPGFQITSLSAHNLAPGLGLFYDGTGTGSVVVSSTDITFDGGPEIVETFASGAYRPIKDVVADINALNVTYTAVAQSDSDKADLVTGTFTVPTGGLVFRHRGVAHVRYLDNVRIRAIRPVAGTAREPWYPRVTIGEFCRAPAGATAGPFRYEVRDYDYQVFDPAYGPPYKRAFDEPTIIDENRLQLLRAPVRSASDVKLFLDGVLDSTLVDQVDLANGIVYLSRSLYQNQDILVDYVYQDLTYVYDRINLNPTLKHNRSILGKYVGIYIIPRKRLGTGETFERTIFHTIRATAQEIVSLVPNLLLADGTNAQARLLSIYNVTQTETASSLEVVDIRIPGGGLRLDLTPRDVAEEEARFYADMSGHWDGEPFPGTSSLVAEIPALLPRTGELELRTTLYESYGQTGQIDPTGWINPTGILTRQEMHERVTRHTKGGAFVIEDFYNE